MSLKVIEKSRKLLIQVMGQPTYDKFIEDGKIEIVHDNIKYELTEDARVYNRTTNESYCIEPICSDNLPIHDQLAIKYGYLKHKIKHVEKVANKRNLTPIYHRPEQTCIDTHGLRIRAAGTGDVEYQRSTNSGRPGYMQYVEYMESLAWRRNQIVIEETSTQFITLYNAEAHTNTKVIDIKCPPGMKLTIKGTNQIREGADTRTAHVLKTLITDSKGNEIPFNTKIRIIKEKPSEETIQINKGFYGDINLTRNNENQKLYKLDTEWFRFQQGIELTGEQHLEIWSIDCERDIYANNTKIILECDLWVQ
jgi:hypothetical protein